MIHQVLDAYLIYMIKVAELMGGTNVEEEMKEILEFEKKLATVSKSSLEREKKRLFKTFEFHQ